MSTDEPDQMDDGGRVIEDQEPIGWVVLRPTPLQAAAGVLGQWGESLSEAIRTDAAHEAEDGITRIEDLVECFGTGRHPYLNAESINCDYPFADPARPDSLVLDEWTFADRKPSFGTAWITALLNVASGQSVWAQCAYETTGPEDAPVLRCQAVFRLDDDDGVLDVVAVSCAWPRSGGELLDSWIVEREGCVVVTRRDEVEPMVPALWLYRGEETMAMIPNVQSVWPFVRERVLRVLAGQLLG